MGKALHHQNEKGITLIELLAVIVILGIVAAIAVPAIGNLIENAKKDAIIANAQNMVDATRLLSVSKSGFSPSDGHMTFVPLGYLVSEGYMNKFSKHGLEVYAQNTQDQPTKNHVDTNWTNENNTYVVIENNGGKIEYYVRIVLHNNHLVLPYKNINDVNRDDITLHNY
ncbi:type II secretion system protein [Lysinibacillus antri]|uniref:Type II secretion system protein n=1 Tax=Lysinibacillus antri TaxID=2498145 RepID=A0A432LAE7_9BACI|nr:type II secretion system protein [Lysinibacillus antri]RUL50507.1 type II secretion system protein [Lysinibacillus antri]